MKSKQTKSLYLALTLLALSMLALSLLAPLCLGSNEVNHGKGYRVWIKCKEDKVEEAIPRIKEIALKQGGAIRFTNEFDDYTIIWLPEKVSFNSVKANLIKIPFVERVVKAPEGFKWPITLKEWDKKSKTEKVIKDYKGKILDRIRKIETLLAWFPEWTNQEKLRESLFQTGEVHSIGPSWEEYWIEEQIERGVPQVG